MPLPKPSPLTTTTPFSLSISTGRTGRQRQHQGTPNNTPPHTNDLPLRPPTPPSSLDSHDASKARHAALRPHPVQFRHHEHPRPFVVEPDWNHRCHPSKHIPAGGRRPTFPSSAGLGRLQAHLQRHSVSEYVPRPTILLVCLVILITGVMLLSLLRLAPCRTCASPPTPPSRSRPPFRLLLNPSSFPTLRHLNHHTQDLSASSCASHQPAPTASPNKRKERLHMHKKKISRPLYKDT